MLKFKDKISNLLLFAIGIGWGHLWIIEFLSCPEWWFIGINALLFGTGISLTRFMPGTWRQTGPALLFCAILLFEISELRSVMLPLVFGLWYGGNLMIIKNWRISRNFCGGLMIGGILAGIFPTPGLFPPALTILMLIYGGLLSSWYTLFEMCLVSIFYIWCFTSAEPPKHDRWIDTGTVICALGMVPADENVPERFPKIVFVGGNSDDHLRCAQELNMISSLLFLPELPGAVPPGSDVIIVCGLPDNGNGASSLYRSLRHNGVLVMPLQYCRLLPHLEWHILPGSDGNFAIAFAGKPQKLDPELMDRQLAGHFRKVPQIAPVQGALSGMLLDFEDQIVEVKDRNEKNFFHFMAYGLSAMCIICILWFCRSRRMRTETPRILINCAGYTMLTALLIPTALLAMPTLLTAHSLITPAINSLIIISALMWVFRRPVKHDKRCRYIGLISLAALAVASWFGNWIAAIISLISGGFAFAALDGDLCGQRDSETEPMRFLGFAAGAFAVSIIQHIPLNIPLLLITAAILRLWSWFRN